MLDRYTVVNKTTTVTNDVAVDAHDERLTIRKTKSNSKIICVPINSLDFKLAMSDEAFLSDNIKKEDEMVFKGYMPYSYLKSYKEYATHGITVLQVVANRTHAYIEYEDTEREPKLLGEPIVGAVEREYLEYQERNLKKLNF